MLFVILLHLLVGVLLLQHQRQPLQEGPHAGRHVEADHALLLQRRAAGGKHVIGHNKLLVAVDNQDVLEAEGHRQQMKAVKDGRLSLKGKGEGSSPWTCWSRRPRPRLESRRCSGWPPSPPPRSAGWRRPVGAGHTHQEPLQAGGTLLVQSLTRRDQMFIRPPTPPDARVRPSGLKASVLTGVM